MEVHFNNFNKIFFFIHMTSTIQLKRSSTTATPPASTLKFGELAISNVAGVTKMFVGLSDNTTVFELAGASYAKLASPSFTGTPTAPTQASVDNSTNIATTQFVKTAIAGLVGALVFKGTIDCSGNPNYPAASVGDLYIVSVAGKIGGASGLSVEPNDQIICIVTNAGGNQAAVGVDFSIIQGNLINSVTSSSTVSVVNNIATMDSTTGRIIKDSGISIDQASSVSTVVQRNIYKNIEVNGTKQLALEIFNTVATTSLTQSDPTYIQYFNDVGGGICTLNLPNSADNDSFSRIYTIVNYGSFNIIVQYNSDGDTFAVATLLPGQQLTVRNRNGEYSFGSLVNLDQRFSETSAGGKIGVRNVNGAALSNGFIDNVDRYINPVTAFIFLEPNSNVRQIFDFTTTDLAIGARMPNAIDMAIGTTIIIENKTNVPCEIHEYSISAGSGNEFTDPDVLYTSGAGSVLTLRLIALSGTDGQGVWDINAYLTESSVIDGGTF